MHECACFELPAAPKRPATRLSTQPPPPSLCLSLSTHTHTPVLLHLGSLLLLLLGCRSVVWVAVGVPIRQVVGGVGEGGGYCARLAGGRGRAAGVACGVLGPCTQGGEGGKVALNSGAVISSEHGIAARVATRSCQPSHCCPQRARNKCNADLSSLLHHPSQPAG